MEELPAFAIVFCLFGMMALVAVVVLTMAIRVVPEYQRLSVFRLGRYMGERGPGLVVLLPMIDRGVPIDTRDQVTKLQAQEKIFGAIGETKTYVHQSGSVELAGEMWNATSPEPIPPGAKVRVARVILEVERL